jgi:hypothetical protein
MKKFSWMVALLIALSLALIGCPTGGGGGGDGPGTGPQDTGWTTNLGEITLDLVDNFQYGKGYQGVLKKAELFAGKQITTGDVYNLKITFTASRNLTDILYVGLVDTTAAASYWKPLTWPGDPDKPAPINGEAADNIIVKDEEITITVTMTATASASDASVDANALVFMTDSTDGTEGTADSGTLGKITLTFTEFIFAKGEIDDGVEPIEPEPEPELPDGAISLGAYTYATGTGDEVGAESQIKWGDKNTSSTPTVAQLQAATDLVIVTENAVAGGVQLIYQTASGYSDWHQTDITTNSGGTTSVATVSTDKKTITVHLAELTDYDTTFATATGIRIILAYFTGATKAHELGQVTAYIIPE